MKFKMKDSDKKILLFVLGAAILALTYFMAFLPLKEKTETLKVENQTLSEEVAYLQKLMDDKEFYVSETDRMNVEIEEIKAQFPSELHPEDEIYYASNSETKYDVVATEMEMPLAEEVSVSVASVADTTQAEVVDDGTASAETVEGESTDGALSQVEETVSASSSITLYRAPISFEFQITYNSVKDWVKEILEDDENKKAISELSLNFDEKTGNLKGEMIVNMYSLTGTERTYESPSIPGIGVGTDDLFKSADRLNAATENNTYDANAENGDAANADDNEDADAEENKDDADNKEDEE
ncbi:MAG: hypothetical protein IJN92_02315 [Lachnospiraceae bacterium]|nr:hypothetical protein [Lachnospiraceae bacterium]